MARNRILSRVYFVSLLSVCCMYLCWCISLIPLQALAKPVRFVEKWLSIRLGMPELDASVADLLALSYELTGPKPRSGKGMEKADGQRSKK